MASTAPAAQAGPEAMAGEGNASYEPRIRSIDLELLHDTDPGMLVSYDLTCHLKKAGLVRYGTHFDPSGRTFMQWRGR